MSFDPFCWLMIGLKLRQALKVKAMQCSGNAGCAAASNRLMPGHGIKAGDLLLLEYSMDFNQIDTGHALPDKHLEVGRRQSI